MSDVRPTGIADFDREIGGGLRPGSLVGLVTPPESQGEQLLRSIAMHMPTIYVSTTRTEEAVRAWVTPDTSNGGLPGLDVRYTGRDSLRRREDDAVRAWLSKADPGGEHAGLPSAYSDPDTQLVEVLEAATDAEGEVVVILDPINPLERADETPYTAFLHRLQAYLTDSGSVAILHMVDTQSAPACRWLSLQMADEVWEMEVDVRNERVEFLMTITKSRSGTIPATQLKFHLDDTVHLDTSRDIG